MKKVLVPLDGSQASEEALPFLYEVCTESDTVLLLSVKKPSYSAATGRQPGEAIKEMEAFGLVTPEGPVYAETEEQSAAGQVNETRDYLERLAAPLRAHGYDVRTDVRLQDHAAEAIIEAARDFAPTFIAFSRSTKVRPPERLFGSVTTRVVESGVAPILFVPSKA